MSVVVLKNKVTSEELLLAKEDYGEYIKFVVDIGNNYLAAGGEWHSDAEKTLLEQGSRQADLWGGGIDLESGNIDYISLINTRPNLNNSQEVSDMAIREKMFLVVKKIFIDYVK